jgi:hypothetical protein
MKTGQGKTPAERQARGGTRTAPARRDGIAVTTASRAYRDLVHALADSVVEYHARRQGVEMVSHVNYSLQRRVQRQRLAGDAASRER